MRLLLPLLILFTGAVFSNELIVRTSETGFYQINASDIAKLDLKKSKPSLGDLSVTSAAGENPYLFLSGKSKLKKNDSLVFFAESLTGEFTNQHPLDDLNGFTLSQTVKDTNTKNWFTLKSSSNKLPTCEKLLTTDHYEVNKYLIRVNTQEHKATPELWYWKQLSYLLKEGFSIPIDVSRMDDLNDIYMVVAFRGRNIDKNASEIPDHIIEIMLNGTLIDKLEWNGKIQHTSEKLKLPKELIKTQGNLITFKVPKRKVGKKTIVDTSMLDYFNIEFEVDPSKITASDSLSSNDSCKIELKKNQIAFSNTQKRFSNKSIEVNPQSEIFIGNKKTLLTPEVYLKKHLKTDFSAIEYLMITHPDFKDSTEVLADFYKNKRIKTAIIDTDQIYQNYSYGVRELHSIKNLIKDIHEAGNGKLKYVLMVGDSSWDWRDNGENNKYGKYANKPRVTSTKRDFTIFPHQKKYTTEYISRDFLPTGQYHSPEGHSASDNWFVSIVPEKSISKGEDYIPDLAIGRLPVSTVAEADAMIAKTINYANNTKVGPWKSRVLWVTNAEKVYQNTSVYNSKKIDKHGVVANNIFPEHMDSVNIKEQQSLSDSFNDGNLVVHFLGHGGKSIWRVGPADLKKNRDLFTLDHVSKLKNSQRLPFVMSMSCYSAPFDHPFADSIGEKFIRESDVGAVAVLASSWRNAPNSLFSSYILESLYNNPTATIGDAVLAGKRRYKGRIMVEMYNLLGDPALRLAIPTLEVATSYNEGKVNVRIDSNLFKGKAIIETIDKNSSILSSREIDVLDTDFSFSLDESDSECVIGKIYAWDAEQNIDAMASFDCSEKTNVAIN